MSGRRLAAYAKHGNYLVKGWLFPGAIEATVRLSAKQDDLGLAGGIAEIGVHHGRFFILLYLLCKRDEACVAIDLFSRQDLNSDHSGAGDLAQFERNLLRHADAKRLVIYEGDSMELTSAKLLELGRGSLRLISIDGGHTPEITAHDLAVSEAALAEGGVIILDDCFNEVWPGVIDGVHTFFGQRRCIVPFGIGGGKTFFCQQRFAEEYGDALAAIDSKAVRREFLGMPVVCFSFRPLTLTTWFQKADPLRLFKKAYHSFLSRLIS